MKHEDNYEDTYEESNQLVNHIKFNDDNEY